MEQKEYLEVSAKLHEMTPSLIDEGVAILQKDPQLRERYGSGIREIVQQGVTTLRDVLLGAVQFDYPQLLGNELIWLEKLLESRQLNPQTLRAHLDHFRDRLSRDLPPAYSGKVLAVFDQAVSQIKELQP
jgi:hypothetical protein